MKKKKMKYQGGGQLDNLQQGLGVASSLANFIPGYGTAIGAGLQGASAIAGMFNRPTPQPVVPTRNSGNFQGGGDINVAPGVTQIQGNPSEIDGESRIVQGTPVQLSHDEIVSIDQEGAHAYSSAKDMRHPLTGKTFAETLTPLFRGRGAAKKTLDKNPTDPFAKNTLQVIKAVEKKNQARQDQMRNLTGKNNPQQEFMQRGAGLPPQQFQGGGRIDTLPRPELQQLPDVTRPDLQDLPLGEFVDTMRARRRSSESIYTSEQLALLNSIEPAKFEELPQGTQERITNRKSRVNKALKLSDDMFTEGGAPKFQGGGTISNASDETFGLTLGDKIGLGSSAVELAAKGFQAFQPARTQTPFLNTAPISRQQFSASEQLRQNQRQFASQVSNINTSNFATNQALRQAAFASKTSADSTALFQNQLANQQARTQFEERLGRRQAENNQARFATQQINAAARDARQQNIDTFLTSVGNVGRQFGSTLNVNAQNRVTLATLNSLSEQYGIDVETLNKIIQGLPNATTTTFKDQG